MYKKSRLLVCTVFTILCIIAVTGGAVAVSRSKNQSDAQSGALQVITVWQIDSFEGGKGSRAEYLKSKGLSFCSGTNVYIEVTSLSSEAARTNLQNGTSPDIISYGAGIYGLENYLGENYYSRIWLRGGYCILSTQTSDFTEVNAGNTIINAGKDNFTSVAAALSGVNGANTDEPTSAYVKLINGQYTYLFGTQRDIVRLQTRSVKFYVQPITQFNDLYQYIAIMTSNLQKTELCKEYINYLIDNSDDISKLCMFYDGKNLYDNELACMENLQFDYTVYELMGKEWVQKITNAAESGDKDKIKSLLKSL